MTDIFFKVDLSHYLTTDGNAPPSTLTIQKFLGYDWNVPIPIATYYTGDGGNWNGGWANPVFWGSFPSDPAQYIVLSATIVDYSFSAADYESFDSIPVIKINYSDALGNQYEYGYKDYVWITDQINGPILGFTKEADNFPSDTNKFPASDSQWDASLANSFNALGGDDVVNAGDNNDTVYGGSGNDTLIGGSGADIIHGGSDNDDISSGGLHGVPQDSGGNTLYGDEGNDTLYGWNVDDGSNLIPAPDTLYGGSGTDQFFVSATPGSSDLIEDFELGESAITGTFADVRKYVIYSSDEGTKVNFFTGDGGAKVASFEFSTRILPQNLIVTAQGNGLKVTQEQTLAGSIAATYKIAQALAPICDSIVKDIVSALANYAVDKVLNKPTEYFSEKAFQLIFEKVVSSNVLTNAVVTVLSKFNETLEYKLTPNQFEEIGKKVIGGYGEYLLKETIKWVSEKYSGATATSGSTNGTSNENKVFEIAKLITLPLQIVPVVSGTVAFGEFAQELVANAIERYFSSETSNLLLSLPETSSGNLNPTIQSVGSDKISFVQKSSDLTTDIGGDGNDTLYTTVSVKSLPENVENATLLQTKKASDSITLNGNDLDNQLTGNSRSNKISDDLGDDVIFGEAGNDNLNGGSGSNTIFGGDGNDTIIVGKGLTLSNETNTLSGNAGNDTITGGSGGDSISGNEGNDVLTGGAGNDSLDGGAGADKLNGGKDDDTYIIADINARGKLDTVTEKANEGIDTVHSSFTYILPSNVENLILDVIDISGIGNSGNNIITGNVGDEILDGMAGNDTLEGGAGIDTFLFDTKLTTKKVGGVVTFTNVDTINDFESGTDDIRLSKKVFSKAAGDSTDPDPSDGLTLSNNDLVQGATLDEAQASRSDLTSNAHFLFDTTAHALYYDTDGSGTKAPIEFAILTGVNTISASDLVIV